MKIIHCGDLHLDSKMESVLPKEKAKERKNEILMTFLRMIEFARKNWVSVIIIAGDMFDTKNVSAKVRNTVLDAIRSNPGITFLYLKGNHDSENFMAGMADAPENLKFFGAAWTKYEFEDVVIAGVELDEVNSGKIYDSLILDSRRMNIVVLHGQEATSGSKDKAEIINLKALRDKNIDYLALGHIHSYKYEPLDSRGVYCYCGCPEGRGFDECGEKGFVWLEAEEGKITHTFVPFACRTVHEVFPDISGAETTIAVEQKVKEALLGILESDLVKVSLTGKVGLSSERDLQYLATRFENGYYAFKINDKEVGIAIRPEEYENDISLRGEFIRTVMAGNYTEEEKRMLLELGIRALNGEEAESCF